MGRPRKTPTLLERSTARGEQRCFPRAAVRSTVVLEDETGAPLLKIVATNVSASGCYLEGDLPIRIGSRLLLALACPLSPTPFRLVGEVVRAERAVPFKRRKGTGIRFVEVPAAVRSLMRSWCR